MPITCFSETEWNKIVSPALVPSLNKAGMAKNFSHAVLYGPAVYQGLQTMHPYFSQEIDRISTHIQESVRGSQTGGLLRGTAEQARLEIGIPFTVGSVAYNYIKDYMTHCWYGHMFKFISDQPIEIVEDYPEIPLLRKHDKFLMQLFLDAKDNIPKSDLLLLNTIRMYLKVISIADIATPDRRRITHNAFLLKEGNYLREHFALLIPSANRRY